MDYNNNHHQVSGSLPSSSSLNSGSDDEMENQTKQTNKWIENENLFLVYIFGGCSGGGGDGVVAIHNGQSCGYTNDDDLYKKSEFCFQEMTSFVVIVGGFFTRV
ncbi:Forkhead box protein P4, variant 3 [Dermatophagoides farinae]|uniref:Forkhead box protein P4, variant 3 n=1 Tax=Dermatophagoides farinae TaxID=6954 RepID=A0A922L8E8_DERFA|nr:Forkhead box protein P4, variant 3 [Dermatophagoides farinae]